MAQNLSLIAAQYQTKITKVFPTGSGLHLIAEANPNRWFIRFDRSEFAGVQFVAPGPRNDKIQPSIETNLPLIYLFRDCPSIVAGEFYAAILLGEAVLVTECIYIGD